MTKPEKPKLTLSQLVNQIKEGKLDYCEISNSTVISLASNPTIFTQLLEAIANSTTLKTVKIGDDITNPKVFDEILGALQKNEFVEALDISGNQAIGNFQKLIELFSVNKNIKALNISNTEVALQTLKEIFENNKSLEFLDYTTCTYNEARAAMANKISIQSKPYITSSLEHNKAGKSIEILQSLGYPDIKIEGAEIPKAIMQIVMEYYVYFNAEVTNTFSQPPALTNKTPEANPQKSPGQPQATNVLAASERNNAVKS